MKLKVFLKLELVLHNVRIFSAVNLSTQRVNRGAFSSVEHSALEKTFVCGFSHFTAERVNFTHKVSLCGSAD